LNKNCLTKEPKIEALLDDCKVLNKYYINTRYPVHWPTEYSKTEAINAEKAAKKIGTVIKDYLSELWNK
ncbi:MAG: HEPN domain-containing protein, partial [Deltaproteobacteria bacterium]|nr:HEPN domain-containing protein [Deltaproteobacteria bacterium]